MWKKIELDKTHVIYTMPLKGLTRARLESFLCYLTLLSMQKKIELQKTHMNYTMPIKALRQGLSHDFSN